MTYSCPQSLTEVFDALSGGAPPTILAGGTDLFPATSAPLLGGPVLDVSGMAELRGVSRTGAGLRIGAATTWSEIRDADLPPCFDALQAAAREVGGRQIQNQGTIGGNLCNASPAADGVPPLLVLDAEVELCSQRGSHRLGLERFITGPRETALADDELLVAVHIPGGALEGRSAFRKLGARRHLVISIAMVAVRVSVADGRIGSAAVAVGACGPVAVRVPEVERALAGLAAGPECAGAVRDGMVAGAIAPIDDIRADAEYRAGAAAELIRRALVDVLGQAG